MRYCRGHMSQGCVVTCHKVVCHMSTALWSHVNIIVCHMSKALCVTCHNGRVTECMDLRCRVTDYDWFLS